MLKIVSTDHHYHVIPAIDDAKNKMKLTDVQLTVILECILICFMYHVLIMKMILRDSLLL